MVRHATESAVRKGKKRKTGSHHPSPTKKKKGRPSKADLARRCQESGGPRRSLRSVRRRRIEEDYSSFGDFESDSEAEAVAAAAEAKKKREKKLKLVLKFPPIDDKPKPTFFQGGAHNSQQQRHHPDSSSGLSAAASSLEEGLAEDKASKKRRINGQDDEDDDNDEDNDDGDVAAAIAPDADEDVFNDDGDVRSSRSDDRNEGKENEVGKSVDSVQGSPLDYPPAATPLPDKKTLEFILHKLQKKDTYGVYAEPVDPKELPDYHDIIEHPMDFSTIRKKLARGDYSTLEQFESDVFLICSNAMQYNAPDSVYFKQARLIQELARKRFEKLKAHECSEMELKFEQKAEANSVAKKSVKKSSSRTPQEPVGSDFSSGATLAAVGDTCTWSNTTQTGGFEKPDNADGLVIDGNSFMTENKHDKTEELTVKGLPFKFGRKPFVVDENRRATYNVSDQLVTRTDSVFTTFESEIKQLVAVGLHADHSYARSLARFAATLGPVAWRVASCRIEQALPAGYKFGRGWVGEYEPPPTPVLLLEKKQLSCCTNTQHESQPRKDEEIREESKAMEDNGSRSVQSCLRSSLNSSAEAVSSKTLNLPKEGTFNSATSEGRPYWFGPIARKPTAKNVQQLQKNSLSMDVAAKVDSNVMKQVEASCSSSVSSTAVDVSSPRTDHSLDMKTSRLLGKVSRSRNPVHSVPFKQQEAMALCVNDHASQAGIANVPFKQQEAITSNANDQSSPSGITNAPSKRQETMTLHGNDYGSQSGIMNIPFKQQETMILHGNGQSPQPGITNVPSKQHETMARRANDHASRSGITNVRIDGGIVASGALPNGKAPNNSDINRMVTSPMNFVSNFQVGAPSYFGRGNHDQGLTDPVKLMRMLSGKSPNQPNSVTPTIIDSSQVFTPFTSSRRGDESNAAATAARAWMSVGAPELKPTDSRALPEMQIAAASLYNPTRELPNVFPPPREDAPGSEGLQPDKSRFTSQAVQQAIHAVGEEIRFQNTRSTNFPQLAATDLSRFPVQSPWCGLTPHTQQKKTDMRPPDLNIGFQSPGSPVQQSPGVRVDSQQPDLALQL